MIWASRRITECCNVELDDVNTRALLFIAAAGSPALLSAYVHGAADQPRPVPEQAEQQPESPAAEEPPTGSSEAAASDPGSEEPPGADLGGSLDELLGLESTSPRDVPGDTRRDDVTDPSRAELERELTGAAARDRFVKAVQQMDETATRLDELSDVGIVTQRLQEEILANLDVLIDFAEQQQRSSSSSSSSQNERQRTQAEQQQQQPGQQRQPGDTRAGDSAPSESPPPPRQAEEFNPMLDAASAAWGALPDRVRSALVQGLSDQFSTRYQRETEAYYRRLADDPGYGDR